MFALRAYLCMSLSTFRAAGLTLLPPLLALHFLNTGQRHAQRVLHCLRDPNEHGRDRGEPGPPGPDGPATGQLLLRPHPDLVRFLSCDAVYHAWTHLRLLLLLRGSLHPWCCVRGSTRMCVCVLCEVGVGSLYRTPPVCRDVVWRVRPFM